MSVNILVIQQTSSLYEEDIELIKANFDTRRGFDEMQWIEDLILKYKEFTDSDTMGELVYELSFEGWRLSTNDNTLYYFYK